MHTGKSEQHSETSHTANFVHRLHRLNEPIINRITVRPSIPKTSNKEDQFSHLCLKMFMVSMIVWRIISISL